MRQRQREAAAIGTIKAHGFDYDELEPAVANFLRGQAQRIRHAIRKSILQLGKDLIEAKRHVEYGAFVRWVEHEVGIPPRTAQGYMRIAQWAEGRATEFSNLPVSILYLLSAQTTSLEVVNNVLAALRRGETITVATVRDQICCARAASSRREENRGIAGYRMSSPLEQPEATSDELQEVADILARCLPLSERSRIYNIMADPTLLSDAQLGNRIRKAFQAALGDPTNSQCGSSATKHLNQPVA
ncbi:MULTISPECIES: DUF3102 domain-containing protein [unclassified Bradyrhizobium]|uniref:DUF3102 domain-containing protein n=1 Tax=unclassified Bradyrhizobium TaxID=2631580 RepID=UPI0028E84EC2|nr:MULTISPECIES: DUF3102 domain-containing protein [unclassified Bradyrhizobium]